MSEITDLTSDLDMLVLIETAIKRVLLGQEYTLDGRTWTMADLSDLQALQKQYKANYLASTTARPRVSRASFSGAQSQ
jgi:hypothetical protein